MPNNDLLVLAECVDARNGKRFFKGDAFDPIPAVTQAKRLIAANCLPAGALALAEAAESATLNASGAVDAGKPKAPKTAQGAAADQAAADAALAAAKANADAARQSVIDAQTALDAATDDTKVAAEKALADAQAAATAADAELKKLTK